METKLEQIAVKARGEPNLRFTSLAHHITRDRVLEICRRYSEAIRRRGGRSDGGGGEGVAERFVVPRMPGNSGGGKGPQFKTDAIRREGPWRLGNLSTPINGQKLQKALHEKA